MSTNTLEIDAKAFLLANIPNAMDYADRLYEQYHGRLNREQDLKGGAWDHSIKRLTKDQYLAQCTDALDDELLSAIIKHANDIIERAKQRGEHMHCDLGCGIANCSVRHTQSYCPHGQQPIFCIKRAFSTLRLYGTVRGLRGPDA